MRKNFFVNGKINFHKVEKQIKMGEGNLGIINKLCFFFPRNTNFVLRILMKFIFYSLKWYFVVLKFKS